MGTILGLITSKPVEAVQILMDVAVCITKSVVGFFGLGA